MTISRSLQFCIAVSVFSVLATTSARADEQAKANEKESLVYELRTYTTPEGKLPALHARFRDHTMKLFKKHGIKNIMYWTPVDKPNTLVYVVAHKSRAGAKKSWANFVADPDWKKAYAKSIEDGRLVTKIDSQFLKPTDYSPAK